MLSPVLNHSKPKDLSEALVPQLPTRAHKDSTLALEASLEMPTKLEVSRTTCRMEKLSLYLMEVVSSKKIFANAPQDCFMLISYVCSYAPGQAPTITNSNSIAYTK
jgi:hypothetical protein